MKHQRVAALFEDQPTAERVKTALVDAGVNPAGIRIHSATSLEGQFRTGDANLDADAGHEHGLLAFFRELFGFGERSDVPQNDATQHHHYAEAVRRGTCVVVVDAVDEHEADRTVSAMNGFTPIDIDQEAARWREAGWSSFDPNATAFNEQEMAIERERRRASGAAAVPADDALAAAPPTATAGSGARGRVDTDAGERTRIPVVDEQLAVGKREIVRGAVRVYAVMREVPVEQTVELREEHARIERHPVDRPATPADVQGLPAGGVIEVRERAEVPVVQKTARVVEEVEVGKDVEHRSETVRDTVRRTDVRVENVEEAPVARRKNTDDKPRG